ncbi:hypothetical protein QNO07_18910 [Streptomyces sp. 549]|uniref:hypothetical protein n=1 Tax=Streptomyces sp. 549 TaxID=3049076 RepID=UPI0024C2C5D9|nr:hypothetical protein [Streptomyces sp. 549]MDK1475464.1 hypothetical protein [Streptomyces sp. 549]
MDDDVRKRLRDAAGAHRPDRARILARVERGMDTPAPARSSRRSRTAAPWPRIALAGAAATGVLLVGGYAVASVVQGDGPQGGVVTSTGPTSPAPEPSATEPSATAEPPAASGSPSAESPADPEAPSSSPPPPPEPDRPSAPEKDARSTEDGPLWSDGSVNPGSSSYWSQSDVTLRTREPLTALTVELRVAQTGGVAQTGNWRSLPEEDFTVAVREDGGELVFRWTLKDGRTVPAGRFVFAGQYDHTTDGRDAKDDAYTARATTEDGRQLAVGGDFAPVR